MRNGELGMRNDFQLSNFNFQLKEYYLNFNIILKQNELKRQNHLQRCYHPFLR